MRLLLLGTGCPLVSWQRAQVSQVVEVAGEPILFDCGAGAVINMSRYGIDPSRITRVFFTHHHFDHNADFACFALTSWVQGRRRLTVYGPPGTASLVETLFLGLYRQDIESRQFLGRPGAGITDIKVVEVEEGEVVAEPAFEVRALKVRHPLGALAYRVNSQGKSLVISGDTAFSPELIQFASKVDVLVQEAAISSPPSYFQKQAQRMRMPAEVWYRKLCETHCTPEEAGRIAQQAQVGTLVLTHFLTETDSDYVLRECRKAFQGKVLIGEDLLAVEC